MKRVTGLFEAIADRENLRRATHRALQGKRSQPDAREFCESLDENLDQLATEILEEGFRPGIARQFWIQDPKPRLITAPAFRERVLHHAIMVLCEPVFERWLIADTFACRTGLGRDKALLRASAFSHRFPYFVQMDVRKFFPSIPRDELFRRLTRIFKDERLLRLLACVLGSVPDAVPTGRGLPIGSLTSQHLANFYLDWLDRFIKEQCRIRGYVRYMDDFVIWGSNRESLKDQWRACRDFLQDELGLVLKRKPAIRGVSGGMSFLGCRVFPTHLTLNRRSRRRFRSRLARLESLYRQGLINERALQERATALVAFTKACDVRSWTFREQTLKMIEVSGQEPRTA